MLRNHPSEHLSWLDSLQTDQNVTSEERSAQDHRNQIKLMPSAEM